MIETAHAKLNLALHLRARREDGYHAIDTLFAFVDAGDRISARGAEADRVTTVGEFAGGILDPGSNLVARALSALPRAAGLDVTLEKLLPVAAGLGGGSADAGAVFRIVREHFGLPGDWAARAARLGADVPACVTSEACIGRGTGTDLEPVDWDLAGTPVLLVNPRVPLPTGPVFAAWNGQDRGGLPDGPASAIARQGRNDLQDPAIGLCPAIADVLAELAASPAWLHRMSGSGATCFALFDRVEDRAGAAARIARDRADWWCLEGTLR